MTLHLCCLIVDLSSGENTQPETAVWNKETTSRYGTTTFPTVRAIWLLHIVPKNMILRYSTLF